MKPLAPLLLALLLLPCGGQEEGDTAEDLRRALVEQLFSERESPKELGKALAAAREAGVPEQALLEARFLFHVDRREDAELAAMLPEFLGRRDTFKLSESEIFAVEEDWLAVVEYVQAIAALRQGDRAGFKKHITEAFWLSPRQGAAFAPHIERLRLDEAMSKVKVDRSLPLATLDGATTDLSKLAGGDGPVLLHFFSPWSRECEDSMPDLIATAKALSPHGIRIVTVIGEPGPEAVAETRGLLARHPAAKPDTWVLDNVDHPLSRTLRVQGVPVMALVDGDGRVDFNGHPAEDALWQALDRIDPEIRRPAVDEEEH